MVHCENGARARKGFAGVDLRRKFPSALRGSEHAADWGSKMSSKEPVSVTDVANLIQAREETRSELRLLAIRAYEHWLELEARIEALELRLDERRK